MVNDTKAWQSGHWVDEQVRGRIERFLTRHGYDGPALVHRVGVVKGQPQAFDLWSPWERVAPSAASSSATASLGEMGLTRCPSRLRNRFEDRGYGHESWIYDGDVLVGRIILLQDTCLPRSLLRSRLNGLERAWRPADSEVLREPAGVAVLAANGAMQASDDGARKTLAERPGLVRLLEEEVARRPVRSAILHSDAEARLRELRGAKACFLVELGPVRLVRLSADADLSPSQRQVVSYAVAGATVQEIAHTLEAGHETIRSHLREAYRRLGVANRLELARALGH